MNIDQTREIEPKVLKKTKVIFSDKEKILKNANVFIITIPTPVDKNNLPNLTLLRESTRTISKYIKKNSLIIYESTVYPGCTEEVCLPILKKNKKLNTIKIFLLDILLKGLIPVIKKEMYQILQK